MCSAGALLVDQYCNPLVFVTLSDILAQLDEIVEEVKKALKIKNPSHPSLRPKKGEDIKRPSVVSVIVLPRCPLSATSPRSFI